MKKLTAILAVVIATLAEPSFCAFGDDIRDTAVHVHHPAGRLVTGTVIFSTKSDAYVLTCAHLWANDADKAAVRVETFEYAPAVPRAFDAALVGKDHDNDLALLAMKVPEQIEACAVWPDCDTLKPGVAVWSLGCEKGVKPTPRRGQFVEWQKSPHGKPRVIAATPAVDFGRSGGGLYANYPGHDGACLVGVLVEFGAKRSQLDPVRFPGTGLYSGPDKIHPFLVDLLPNVFGRWIRCDDSG